MPRRTPKIAARPGVVTTRPGLDHELKETVQMADNALTQPRAEGKLALLRVDLLARPLGERPTGFWWLTTGELVGAQLEEALAVRRGLAAKVAPVAGGAQAEAAALEMAATFSYFVDQLRADLVEQPFCEIAYATREDPTGRRAALTAAHLCALLVGGEVREDPARGFSVTIPGEIEPEAIFLLARPAEQGALQ